MVRRVRSQPAELLRPKLPWTVSLMTLKSSSLWLSFLLLPSFTASAWKENWSGIKFLPNLLRQNTCFVSEKCIFLLPSETASAAPAHPPHPLNPLAVVWLVTKYSLDPAVSLAPFTIQTLANLLLCISICLSFASSPPPPPHWATASFTQPVSRVLQVHILSKRQTFHSLFIETITLWDCCGDSTLTTAPPHWSLPPPRCSLDSTFIHYLSLIVGFRYIIEKGGWQ